MSKKAREVRIWLRDTVTGDEAWHVEKSVDIDDARTDEEQIESLEFIWTDGNYACDCNRAQFLATALGKPDPNPECGSQRIVIVEAFVDGVAQKWQDS